MTLLVRLSDLSSEVLLIITTRFQVWERGYKLDFGSVLADGHCRENVSMQQQPDATRQTNMQQRGWTKQARLNVLKPKTRKILKRQNNPEATKLHLNRFSPWTHHLCIVTDLDEKGAWQPHVKHPHSIIVQLLFRKWEKTRSCQELFSRLYLQKSEYKWVRKITANVGTRCEISAVELFSVLVTDLPNGVVLCPFSHSTFCV